MAPLKEGLWPDSCIQRAFCDGAKWWEYHSTNFTMWPTDQDLVEEEAIRRYGDPGPEHHGYGCPKDGEPMTEWCDECHKLAKEQEEIGF